MVYKIKNITPQDLQKSAPDFTTGRWPSFFLVGPAKTGTTSLYYYLSQHPEIFMSRIKEPNFFTTDYDINTMSRRALDLMTYGLESYLNSSMKKVRESALIRDWDGYASIFRMAEEHHKAIGECSVSYFTSKDAADNIHTHFPNARIIIMLRDPVDRLYSRYLMSLRDGSAVDSFRHALEKDLFSKGKCMGISTNFISSGMYVERIKKFDRLFGIENVLLIPYEDLKKSATVVMQCIFRFLGVDDTFMPDFYKKYNTAKAPRFRGLNRLISTSGKRQHLKMCVPDFLKRIIKACYYTDKHITHVSPEDRKWLSAYFEEDQNTLKKYLNERSQNSCAEMKK